MQSKKQILLPKFQKIAEKMGENIKLARKRRKLTTIQVAERAGIDRTTLYHIEKGNPSVSIGAYFNTLKPQFSYPKAQYVPGLNNGRFHGSQCPKPIPGI